MYENVAFLDWVVIVDRVEWGDGDRRQQEQLFLNNNNHISQVASS